MDRAERGRAYDVAEARAYERMAVSRRSMQNSIYYRYLANFEILVFEGFEGTCPGLHSESYSRHQRSGCDASYLYRLV